MANWWTKPPIIIAAIGGIVVIFLALLPRTTITQHTSGAGSPAIGSAGGNVTITAPSTAPSPSTLPPASPSERPRSWHRPLYAFRGGLRGAGASSTDSNIAANIERGF